MIETLKKELIHLPFVIVVTILLYAITVFADTIFHASMVDYDNTTSGIAADRVQGAVDELHECIINRNSYSSLVAATESIIGSGTLQTTAQTLTGAVKEINDKFNSDGTLKITYGGTGATTAAAARTNLGMPSTSDLPSYNSGSSATYKGLTVTYRKYGQIVTIKLTGTATSDIPADESLFTLPTAYRPVGVLTLPLFSSELGSATSNILRVFVRPEGGIRITHDLSKDSTIYGSLTFITEN